MGNTLPEKRKPHVIDIDGKTIANNSYRKVVYTLPNFQLVLMSLSVGEDIPKEVHPDTTQFIRIEGGQAKVIVDSSVYFLNNGDTITIAAGSEHEVSNNSELETLKLYTIYTIPEHEDGLEELVQPDN